MAWYCPSVRSPSASLCSRIRFARASMILIAFCRYLQSAARQRECSLRKIPSFANFPIIDCLWESKSEIAGQRWGREESRQTP
jgi:hypothetical protein